MARSEREKPIEWWGTSYEDLLRLPDDVIDDMGFQLDKVQHGENPDDFGPMPKIGPGTYEIRICGGDHYRAFYVAKLDDRIHVLHVFMKKSKQGKATPKQDIEKASRNYRAAAASVLAKKREENRRR